jgi:hypothetical protein
MTSAIPVHVALVDATGRIDWAQLQEVAGALNEQVQADFAPVWHVRATVGVYAEVPAGTWQVVIQAKLDEPDALGYHLTDAHNQPVSYVEDTNDWPVSVSHELLEMLADPFGNRMHSAALPHGVDLDWKQFGLKRISSRVHYLLEVCDPCENTSYEVGGVALSDFLLPTWYRTWAVYGTNPYSRAGACQQPREIADGGYVSFANADGEWFQVFSDGGKLSAEDLGKYDRRQHASLREFVDAKARKRRAA